MENDLLALVEQDGFRTVQKSTSRGGQYNGPCPWCGGTDRFRVQPSYGNYGFFACNQCKRSGSAVDYLMLMRGLSKWEALLTVGWKPSGEESQRFAIPAYAYQARPQWDEPPERWQEAAAAFYRACQRVLWSPRGKHALAYLRGRGLNDATIQKAMLGYHPTEASGLAREWGKLVRLPQGIVIPWFFKGAVWRLTIRDERVAAGAGRYRQITGGSNGLYLADSLTLKRPAAVLVEGEFDALSLVQEYGDLVSVVATGTTQGGHTPHWLSRLSTQPLVLVAFDAEDKGDAAAIWWIERVAQAQRLRPLWKDANQMLQDGADLRAWIASALPAEHEHKKNQVTPTIASRATTEPETFTPCVAPEPYRRFLESMKHLKLPHSIPLRVITPRGKGNLWQVLGTRIGVVLDSDPKRVTFFEHPAEREAIQPLEEILSEVPDYLR